MPGLGLFQETAEHWTRAVWPPVGHTHGWRHQLTNQLPLCAKSRSDVQAPSHAAALYAQDGGRRLRGHARSRRQFSAHPRVRKASATATAGSYSATSRVQAGGALPSAIARHLSPGTRARLCRRVRASALDPLDARVHGAPDAPAPRQCRRTRAGGAYWSGPGEATAAHPRKNSLQIEIWLPRHGHRDGSGGERRSLLEQRFGFCNERTGAE